MSRYLLDTNVISEPLRRLPDPRVVDRLHAAAGEFAIASIVWHELVFGAERAPRSRRRSYLERYLQDVVLATCEVLPYDASAAVWHARERARLVTAGRPPSFADGQIAAIAAANELILVTRNERDFRRFEGLSIENWFSSPAS